MNSNDGIADSAKNLRIILVHGTWGRGFVFKRPVAPWCRIDSSFVSKLKSALEQRGVCATILPFNWSGDNSILERATAANELKNFIESNAEPTEPVLLVAHSHGGNVVLQSISKLTYRSNVHVCTLATPFLRLYVTARKWPDMMALLSLMVTSPFFFLFAGIAHYFFAAVVVPFPAAVNITAIALIIVIAGCPGLVIGFFLNSILINPYPKNGPPSRWQQKPELLSEATFADASLLGDRLLVLRGIDDEASLTLALGAATNRLMRVAYIFAMGPIVERSVVVLFIMSFFAAWIERYLAYLACVMAAVAFLSVLMPGLIRTVFGRELAFGALRCDAVHDSVPDSSNSLVKTLQNTTNDARLFHSLHQNPTAPSTIANWVAEKMAAKVKSEVN